MRDLAGKTAFITGAAGGIGSAFARALAREGMKLALADLDEARVVSAWEEALALGADALALSLDVTDYADWQRAVDAAEARLGQVALLVNSAGIGTGTRVAEEDPARWRRVLEINALGPFYGCRTVLPRMLAQDGEAHIVNIASLSGLRANPGMSSYDASKFALVGMSDALRLELAGTKVGLSVVYPGMTRTGFIQNSVSQLAREAGAVLVEGGTLGNILDGGMSPDRIAEFTLRAVRASEYHVFTHADWKPAIQAVFDERMAAYGEGADPTYHEDLSGLKARIEQTMA
jgi:NAD(P)-dependent dehydrogenase (short-subunit alcohol dehydrogenase family)